MLKLYPPRWRRRYGAEFLALIAPQPFSIGTAFDIIGGAIDAWTQPQSYPSPRAATHEGGDKIMLAKAMRLRCAGYGEKATIADGLKGAAWILGSAVVTVIVMFWLPRQPGGHPYRVAFLSNGWLFWIRDQHAVHVPERMAGPLVGRLHRRPYQRARRADSGGGMAEGAVTATCSR
jgi:hypothetical protein